MKIKSARMRGPIVTWITVLLVSCSSSKIKNDLPEVDLTLIKADTTQYHSPYPLESPYVAKFQSHGKTLLYAAVNHAFSKEYPNLFDSPTFKTIHQLIQDYPVDAVVVEGIPGQGLWREGDLPPALVTRCNQCEANRYDKCGEPYFAIQEGRKRNAKIFRGEPLETEVTAEILREGFTIDDLLGFYIVRMIPTWKMSGEFNAKSAKGLIENRIIFEKRQIAAHTNFNYDRFLNWYSAHMQHPASFMDIEMQDTGGTGPEKNTYIQKISHAVGVQRDKSVALQIHQALTEANTVLVVFGSSHYLDSRNALEKMMGKAQLLKLY